MEFLIITGLSGAGKSRAADVLEDLEYYCVDNMPVKLMPRFAELCLDTRGRYEKVALVTDVRERESFGELLSTIDELKAMEGCSVRILYMDAELRTLVRRYKESRRPHPLAGPGYPIEKAIEQINYVHQSQREHSQLESLKSDLAIACEIQQAILPRVFPPFPDIADKLDIAALMTPAKDVGGDFYDFFHIDENRIGFVIADVSGKGIPAAIFMAVSRTLIRATGIRGGSPAECIDYSNKLLAAESVDCMFVTVFYGIMDISTGEIVYCNAGHNPPCILTHSGEVKPLPMSNDAMVGAVDGLEYTDATLQLDHGDTLFMYTDGVTEALDKDNGEFGEQRMQTTLAGAAGQDCQSMVESMKTAVAAFAGEAEQSDDITVMALKRL